MTDNNNDFMKKLRILADEQPPGDLYERIMTVAPHLPQMACEAAPMQRMPWWHPVRLFGDWETALVFKFAVFAVLAYGGVAMGQAMPQDAGDVVVFAAIIDGQIGWEG
jgi:hypothetical protein